MVPGGAEPFGSGGSGGSSGSREGERPPRREQRQRQLGVQEQMFCRGTCWGDPERDMPFFFFFRAGMILIHPDSISSDAEKASLHPPTAVQIQAESKWGQSYLRGHGLDEEIHFCQDAFKEYIGSRGLILQRQQLVWRMLFTPEHPRNYRELWSPSTTEFISFCVSHTASPTPRLLDISRYRPQSVVRVPQHQLCLLLKCAAQSEDPIATGRQDTVR